MDFIGDPFESSSSKEHEVEAVDDLLEEGWFFGNFLNTRNRMLRCNSDPSPSSNLSQEMLVKNSTKKLPSEGHHSLIRGPSLPSWIGREGEVQDKESSNNTRMSKLTRQKAHQYKLQRQKEGIQESEARMSKLIGESSRRSLLRTPSLPPRLGREDEEIQDEESYARLSNLIRQALPNTSDILPPRHISKGMTQSYSIPRNRPPRNLEVDTIDTNTAAKEMRRRYLNQRKLRRSSTDLEFEELQGFKDLGFTFDKDDLTPSVVSILPGLQEKKNQKDLDQDKMMRRPYLSEAWLVQRQSCAPPIPNCVKQSSAEDMKAQIKFWARAVASNVK